MFEQKPCMFFIFLINIHFFGNLYFTKHRYIMLIYKPFFWDIVEIDFHILIIINLVLISEIFSFNIFLKN